MKYVLILVAALLLPGCWFWSSTITPPAFPALPTPEVSALKPLASDASERERATYFRELADRYAMEANAAEKRADAATLHARQQWFNIVGYLAIGLGIAAFILSFWYPLGGLLAASGSVAIAVGITSILLGELLPYLWIVALVALVAIVGSLVVGKRATDVAIDGWKDSAARLPEAAKNDADKRSLVLQVGKKYVREHIDKLIRKE